MNTDRSKLLARYKRGAEINAAISKAQFNKLFIGGYDLVSGRLSKQQEAYIARKVMARVAEEQMVFIAEIRADCRLAWVIEKVKLFCGKDAAEFLLSETARLTPDMIVRVWRKDPDELEEAVKRLRDRATGGPPAQRAS